MKIEYAGMSLKGGREVNEDSFVMLKDQNKFCFSVADGLGGHGKGEVASLAATDSVARVFQLVFEDQKEKIAAMFEESQKSVLEKQKEVPGGGAMRTTLTVLSFENGWANWGHIGDSRIYCFRNHRFAWRTLDHSVPQMLVALGEIKESEIRHHEDRNRILRVIGAEWNGPEYELSKCPFRPRPNDKFILCSDGFWENIEDEEMIDCARKSKNATEWLSLMKKTVIEKTRNKDSDNFTAVAIWFK